MKKLLSLAFVLFLSLSTFAQKGISQFALFGGYETFPELRVGKGYNVGVEFKHYMHNRFYVVGNFHAGVNNGSYDLSYTDRGKDYDFTLFNSVRDYMIGLGLGADALQIKRHKIYVQGTVGLGSSDEQKDGISLIMIADEHRPTVKTNEVKVTRYAISASAGYDYQLTGWLAVGVNYTLWFIGYESKNSYNAKVSFIF